MSDVEQTKQPEIDSRRNRVVDPDIQNAFLGGVNEGRPEQDAIGKPKTDEPMYGVLWDEDGTEMGMATPSLNQALDIAKKALTNGFDVRIIHGEQSDVIDAEVVD